MTNKNWLSIDPGTLKTGVASWRDDHLLNWWLIRCPPREPIDQRFAFIAQAVQTIGLQTQAAALVCEKPFSNPRVPAHEVNVLFNRLRHLARDQHWDWVPLHPSSVVAAVRPRGFKGHPTKEVLRAGVGFLYGLQCQDLDQNVIDAIAVGHCHLTRQQENAILIGEN